MSCSFLSGSASALSMYTALYCLMRSADHVLEKSHQKGWNLPDPNFPVVRLGPLALLSNSGPSSDESQANEVRLVALCWRQPSRLSCFLKNTLELWNRAFPVISANKDVTAISYLGPPNVKLGVRRAPKRETNACNPSAGKNQEAGCWHQVAEVRKQGMISVSPDACIFPYIETH